MAYPATLVVLIVASLLIILGILLTLISLSGRGSARCHTPGCGFRNARDAAFCARCGKPLSR